jgi:hypothetical protein
MSDAKQVESPNWVEGATFVLVLLGVAGAGVKFWIVDWPQHVIASKKSEIDLRRAEEPRFSVIGEVSSPDLFVVDGDRSVPICPVVVEIQNDGDVPIHLDSVEFRVFVAHLGSISRRARVGESDDKIVLATRQVSDNPGRLPAESIVGAIDPHSSSWEEKADLCRKIEHVNNRIPPGQRRLERFHLLAPTSLSTLVTKVEVTVKTAAGNVTWYGFANPQMCAPIPPELIDRAPSP